MGELIAILLGILAGWSDFSQEGYAKYAETHNMTVNMMQAQYEIDRQVANNMREE